MKHAGRLLGSGMAGLVLALVMGGAASPAAASGGLVIYVNDTTANDPTPTFCPPTPYTTILAGLGGIGSATSNVTLTICPGTYAVSGSTTFTGMTNLKMIGKGGPVVVAPIGFSGTLFLFDHVTNATVQGLTIDGQGQLGANANAIEFHDTSGMIKQNTISSWHELYGPTVPTAPAGVATGIMVHEYDFPANVTVQQNTLHDMQDFGIWAMEPYAGGKATIVKNRVVMSPNITPIATLADGPAQAGIALFYSAAGSSITGNQILSESDLYPAGSTHTRGIALYESSGTKVTGNTIRGVRYQITVESYCEFVGYANANGNTISGNKLYDVSWDGLLLTASTLYATACGTPHADLNMFTGNKVYTQMLVPSTIPYGTDILGSGTVTINGNQVKGNTFAGFVSPTYAIHQFGTGITGLVSSPNKYLAAPPAGPLSASPAAGRDAAPAGGWVTNLPQPPAR